MTGFVDFVKWENDILTFHGLSFLGIGMLLVFWVIIFAVSKRLTNDSFGGLVAASFATTILSILFFITGLVNTMTVLIFIALLVVGVVLLRLYD